MRQEITVYLKSEVPKVHQNQMTASSKSEALKKRYENFFLNVLGRLNLPFC